MAEAKGGRSLVLDAITHRYPGGAIAVENINLDVKGGEIIALLGPSGCGKTTLLRIVAGFIAQTQGRIIIGDEIVDRLPPNKRAVGIVFQNYALFPHLTIAENVAYGLAARGVDSATRRREAQRLLELVQLPSMGERLPRQLSGGQQQRVALARALAIKPSILLLDEPFAALDKNLRLDMQIEVKRLQRVSGITTLIVTHDQEEALSMADRVAVLSQGRLEQFGSPSDVYDRPQTLFVNTFVGSTNRMPGTLVSADPTGAKVRLDAGAEIIAQAGNEIDDGRWSGHRLHSARAFAVRDRRFRLCRRGRDGPAARRNRRARSHHRRRIGRENIPGALWRDAPAGERRRGAHRAARSIPRHRISCITLNSASEYNGSKAS